ncbi:hypothetical protein HW532_06565 [Kaustia mangrovi]|uniref:Peptidase C45 hydrolase domain-containing protein n=1 Tax=Kaustia mangrovi TaxID=2593653 RepID=A0A7S8C2X9_9HYPH|nr:C45 family peptidase [Kaustia mangrovi]QPC42396.1 hypothetical protein HW532_06565 [Kaustia mangrovi]
MSNWLPDPSLPVMLSGDAHERGLGQARKGGAGAGAVRNAVAAAVDAAGAAGLLDPPAQAFLDAQRAFAQETDPASLLELRGIAEGFDIPEPVLFVHLHLGILRDLKATGPEAGDGCSAWAVADGTDGPMVVKNRDFRGTHLGIQRVFRHKGPDIHGGEMLCVGSLGSPGAYSSGINGWGLALVDTQVGTGDHGVGWLRYFLMTRLLSDCRTVEDAVRFVSSARHAGGGTLVMADPSGAVAAVELGNSGIAVERGSPAFRTNHFVSPELAGRTLQHGGDRAARNSHARFAGLGAAMASERNWSARSAADLMASHVPGDGSGSLCQHPVDGGDSSTISSAIFACRRRRLYFAEGNPCEGRWRRYELDA